ncbi:MAG: DivIVA domain-containing protein [Firmicutes bacterium]|jgi:cell division initiation protein|nr:DivIVA domain-containing protein [Bacillota bacterium]
MLTPLDIQKKEFRRRLRGYSEEEVDEFLDQILEDYEMLYRQNASLKDEASRLKEETERYRNLEDTLKNTLVLSQKAADETRANAQKEAELIRAEAQAKARALEEEGQRRLAEINAQIRELQAKVEEYKAQTKALLQGAIALLETRYDVAKEAAEDVPGEVAASSD